MERVIALISVIQTPQADKEFFSQTQRELQLIQKSEDGWELAKALLSIPDSNTQFIGAQTFLVQLNEKSKLPAVPEMKSDLVESLQHAVLLNYSGFVVRKLIACIVKLFYMLKDELTWTECPNQIAQLLPMHFCLEFFQILVEDSELDSVQLRSKLEPYFLLVAAALEPNFGSEDAIKVFCLYASNFFSSFKSMIPFLLVQLRDQELASSAAPAISELFQTHSHQWPVSSKKQLGEIFTEFVYNSVPDDSEYFNSVSELIVDVCTENVNEYTDLHPFLMTLAGLNTPVVEDTLAFPVLGFWNQYVDEVISSGMESTANEVISQVISHYWPRIKLYTELPASDYNEFNAFRIEFADFLELAYQLVGANMFEDLTAIVLNSLQSSPPDWFSIESSLFCLNSLSEIIGESYDGSKPEFSSIRHIFESKLWLVLPECRVFRVRQTAVNVIGCYVDFFQTAEGRPYLATTLNFLFGSLELEQLQLSASKSIQKLCRNCRAQLVNEIEAFLAVYEHLRNNLESGCHARVVSGIGCVLESLTDLQTKTEAVSRLIELVLTSSCEQCLEETETMQLQCLAAIGKSQQSENTVSLETAVQMAQFYSTNQLALSTHHRLQQLVYAVNATDVSAVESVCELIKTGLPEPAGLFVFSNEFIIEFISSKLAVCFESCRNPLLDLARFLVCTQLSKLKDKSFNSAGLQMPEIKKLIEIAFVSNEPSSGLDLVLELVKTLRVRNVGLEQVPGMMECLLEIAVPALTSNDRFVLRSAMAVLKEVLLPRVELNGIFLQKLLLTVITLVSGQASRSDLTAVSDILKLLIARHQMQSSQWLNLLVVESPANENLAQLDLKTRTDFVAQLMLVKGGRKTQEIVQRLWQKCRGIPDTYTPLNPRHP